MVRMAIADQKQPRPPHKRRSLALLLGMTAALAVAIGAWAVGPSVLHSSGSEPSAASQSAFEEATGVQLVRITVSAGGGMLDLRYRIMDPDKAAIVHDKKKPPTIVDEATGRSASQSWMPHHGGGEPKFAVTYYELIYNPDGIIKRGDRVTLVIGDTRLAHVIVQ